MNKEKHVVLEELLRSINFDWKDTACDKAEQVFNSQEADIDELFEKCEILKIDYESLFMDYERLVNNPSVVVEGLTYDALGIKILKEQLAAASGQILADIHEIDAKDAMIDAMIEGFNLRNRIHYDRYDVGDYDWSLVLKRIEQSKPDERIVRIERMEKELKQLKDEIHNE